MRKQLSFLLSFVFYLLVILSSFVIAQTTETPAEVKAAPSGLSSGSENSNVYLLGTNPQVFSHSSKKDPTVEMPTGITVKTFAVSSPKRALMVVDVLSSAFGSYQCSLKFYDSEGENVVKTCVFYLNALGPITNNDYTITLTSLPEISIDTSSLQTGGYIEIKGPLAGNVTVSTPAGVKFNTGLKPQVSSLTVGAEVTDIEVAETGDSFTFYVNNPGGGEIRIFISGLYFDTLKFTEDNGQKGEIALTFDNINLPSGNVQIPVGHTPGYTVSTNVETPDEKDNNEDTGSNPIDNPTNPNTDNNTPSSDTSTDNNPKKTTNRESQKENNRPWNRERWEQRRQKIADSKKSQRSQRKTSRNPRNRSRYVPRNRYSKTNTPSKRSTSPPSSTSKSSSNKDEDDSEDWKKKARITTGEGIKLNIVSIMFCNVNYEHARAVPLVATDKGFLAKMNVEIKYIENNNAPDKISVFLLLPGHKALTVTLKKIKRGVYRSTELLEVLIPFDKILK